MEANEKVKNELAFSFKYFLDPVFFIDTNGIFSDMNDAFCEMVGYNKTEIIGKSIMDIEFLPEESKQNAMENFKKVLAREKVLTGPLKIINKNGNAFFVEISANPVIKALRMVKNGRKRTDG